MEKERYIIETSKNISLEDEQEIVRFKYEWQKLFLSSKPEPIILPPGMKLIQLNKPNITIRFWRKIKKLFSTIIFRFDMENYIPWYYGRIYKDYMRDQLVCTYVGLNFVFLIIYRIWWQFRYWTRKPTWIDKQIKERRQLYNYLIDRLERFYPEMSCEQIEDYINAVNDTIKKLHF